MNKRNYLNVLCECDFETIVLALEREERMIIEVLNSGKVFKDDQDKALRDRCYTVQELLGRLTGAMGNCFQVSHQSRRANEYAQT